MIPFFNGRTFRHLYETNIKRNFRESEEVLPPPLFHMSGVDAVRTDHFKQAYDVNVKRNNNVYDQYVLLYRKKCQFESVYAAQVSHNHANK